MRRYRSSDTIRVVNPQTLIADLIAAGWTQVQIAAELQCAQSTVSTLATKDTARGPSLKTGLALIELHRKVCGRKRKQVEAMNGRVA